MNWYLVQRIVGLAILIYLSLTADNITDWLLVVAIILQGARHPALESKG